ncbi:glycosyltransferase family 25 protein [Martelella soudanensis]|uniref:glycosyltransferase family 25 protein n=1 Tax=Martelella sp. NC18 TaxID=2740297 RepID=UPI002111E28D|nr:glycosyltransferase family 25 protein [Martelella sp. NC18]
MGMPVEVFDAVTPATADLSGLRYDETRARRFTGRPMTDTEKACALSHLSLWRALQQDEAADYYLILEDDSVIFRDVAAVLEAIDLGPIDFLKLSGKKERPMRTVAKLATGERLVRYAFGPLDAAAYLVSKRGARRLEAYCETLFTPIDLLMDRSYDHGVPVYGVLPYPVYAEFCMDPDSPLFSDIGRRVKYADDVTLLERFTVRFHRIVGSFKRKRAAIRLRRMRSV